MRLEISELHKPLKTTMVYVTHDQVEAMTMADKIVVLNAGRIEQVGSPLELYDHPANLFVAGFIGSPKMNLIDRRPAQPSARRPSASGRSTSDRRDGRAGRGKVSVAEHLGSDTFFYVDVGGSRPADGARRRRIRLRSGDPCMADAERRITHRRSASIAEGTRDQTTIVRRRQEKKMYLEKLKLDGRVAVVTGGGQGIGAACVEALGEAGAIVIAADRHGRGRSRQR